MEDNLATRTKTALGVLEWEYRIGLRHEPPPRTGAYMVALYEYNRACVDECSALTSYHRARTPVTCLKSAFKRSKLLIRGSVRVTAGAPLLAAWLAVKGCMARDMTRFQIENVIQKFLVEGGLNDIERVFLPAAKSQALKRDFQLALMERRADQDAECAPETSQLVLDAIALRLERDLGADANVLYD